MFCFMRCIKRAWSDTFHFLGGWGLLFGVVAIPLVGFALHAGVRGPQAMMPEFEIWLIYGLAATGIVFSGIFLWNLVWARYRLEREAHEKTKALLDAARSALPTPRVRRLNGEQRSALSDAIRQVRAKPDPIYIAYAPGSEECADLVGDLKKSLEQAGIRVSFQKDLFHEDDPTERGVKINHGRSKVLTSLADAIHGSLKDSGIHSERIRGKQPDGFSIYVARASQ